MPSRPALPLALLAAAAFLSSAGTRVVDPVLHAIATDFRVGVPDVAIVIAAFGLPYGLAQLVLGPVGDRFGKLRVVLGSLISYAVFTGACALAGDLSGLVLLRACAGAASAGLIPVAVAYIGDSVPYGERQVTLSKFLTGVVLAGMLAGPLGGVFGEYVGWRGVFLVLAGLAVLVAGGLAWRIRGLPDARREGRMFNPELYVRMARNPVGRLILLAGAIDGALFVGCFPFVAPYLHEHFGLSYAEVGLLLAFFGVGAWAYTLLAQRLVRRLGEGGMVLAGGIMMVVALVLAVEAPHWGVFVVVEFLLGLGFFTLHSVLQAQASEILPQARATAVATFACLLFLGQSSGSLLFGRLIALFDYKATFLIDAVLVLMVAVWLWRTLRRPPSSPHG